MASLSTIDIAKIWSQFFFYPTLNLSNCSGEGSKANMGGGFEKTYQPIVEALTVPTTFCLRLLTVLAIHKCTGIAHLINATPPSCNPA